MELPTLKLEKHLSYRRNLQRPEKAKNFIFLFTFFCLLRENFSNMSKAEKVFYTFSYKKAVF